LTWKDYLAPHVARRNYSMEYLMQTPSKLAASLAGINGIETLRLYRTATAAMATTWKALSKQS
tara:strand:+ start:162 stop:350 length:189 start_codon:yes stop_codon:yes gene_type:complete